MIARIVPINTYVVDRVHIGPLVGINSIKRQFRCQTVVHNTVNVGVKMVTIRKKRQKKKKRKKQDKQNKQIVILSVGERIETRCCLLHAGHSR